MIPRAWGVIISQYSTLTVVTHFAAGEERRGIQVSQRDQAAAEDDERGGRRRQIKRWHHHQIKVGNGDSSESSQFFYPRSVQSGAACHSLGLLTKIWGVPPAGGPLL